MNCDRTLSDSNFHRQTALRREQLLAQAQVQAQEQTQEQAALPTAPAA
jgi:hypothetical protein